MKQKGIYFFLAILTMLICGLIVFDFNSTSSKSGKNNPYILNLEEFRVVDPTLIHYQETRNIRLNCETPRSISFLEDKLYIGADQYFQVIDLEGKQLLKVDLPGGPNCIYPSPQGLIYIAFRDYIAVFDQQGQHSQTWESLGDSAVITGLAMKDTTLFVADAGNRCVVVYALSNGNILGIIKGKISNTDLHGFVVPSPNFDLAVNPDGELWVVNPGRHAIENYTDDGQLRTYWEATSPYIDGFSGCCNPAHLAILPDGSFVTSEQKLVRIKIHKPSGELISVVAPPTKFVTDGQAPDISVSPEGLIYALDIDRKMVRIFEKKLSI
ncbi:MAG: hypothetical protein HKN87_19560 [Saprospiraceae bacterium]|nr:hypothetical protein [Saprospiraceae bacterium]